MTKKEPQRTCMGCHKKKDKKDMLRIVKNKNDGEIHIDSTGKMEGRGAYVCQNVICLENLRRSKKLNKVFDMDVSEEVFDKIRGVILGR